MNIKHSQLKPVEAWNHRWNLSYRNSRLVYSQVSLTSWGEDVPWALAGHSSSDGVTKKIPYGVNLLLHQPTSNLIFFCWVGYNWIWIIRSVETDLGKWKLVEVEINIDAYLFFGFHRTDLSPWEYRDSLNPSPSIFHQSS